MSFTRAAVCLAIAAAAAPAADRIPTELFPPSTRVVVSISLRALHESPLLRDFTLQAGPKLPDVSRFAGVDFVHDVDTLVIGSTGEGDNAPGVVIMLGRFDASRLPGAHLYDGVPVLDNPKETKTALAVLDAYTAIGGSLADVHSAIRRRGGAPALSADLTARIDAHSTHDIWAVGDIPEGIKSTTPAAQNLSSVDRFDFYASLRDGLRVEGDVHVKSAKDLAQLETTLAMFRMMVPAQQQPGGPEFNLRSENGNIHLALYIPEAELKKGLAAKGGALAGMFQPGAAAGAAPVAVTAPAPARIQLSHPPAAAPTVVTNSSGDVVQVTIK